MKKQKLWYVIADGGKARFVERDGTGAYRTVASFVSTDLQKRSSDLGRDRPARTQESASPARHAIEPRRDLHEAAKEDFVRLVAEQLDLECERRQFDRLMLVAPPKVLAELRKGLSRDVVTKVVEDRQKDLTNVPDHELAPHLSLPQ